MREMYEVLLIDGDTRWHAGWVIEKEADLLLHIGSAVPVWSSRPGLLLPDCHEIRGHSEPAQT